jgi:hypothetical protein
MDREIIRSVDEGPKNIIDQQPDDHDEKERTANYVRFPDVPQILKFLVSQRVEEIFHSPHSDSSDDDDPNYVRDEKIDVRGQGNPLGRSCENRTEKEKGLAVQTEYSGSSRSTLKGTNEVFLRGDLYEDRVRGGRYFWTQLNRLEKRLHVVLEENRSF